jgi:hypothetical protein
VKGQPRMDFTRPSSAVVASLDADVLAVVAGTSRPLTGRDVHRLAHRGSHTGVQRILTRMAEHGLLDVTEAGRARLYTLNRDHVAAPVALALLDLRGQLFTRIRDALANWEIPPLAAAVFGSAARGDGDTDSDIDLFLVRPEGVSDDDSRWAGEVDELGRQVRRWSGNPLSVIQVEPGQVTDMIDRADSIVAQLRADAVPLTARGVLGSRRWSAPS